MTVGDGATIAYDVRGAGTEVPLLLLRPSAGGMKLWGRFRDECARHLRVLSFDPRGQGASSKAPLWWSTDEMAEDAIALLDFLGLESANVFGLSIGGMVAMRLAIDHPRRIGKLVVASTVDHGHIPSLRSFWEGARVVEAIADPSVSYTAGAVEATTECHHAAVVEMVEAAGAEPSRPRTLVSNTVAALRFDMREEVKAIHRPTLVLAGARDELTPPALAVELAGKIERAELTILDAGHDVCVDQPVEAAHAVVRFLTGVAPARHDQTRNEARP